MNAGRRLSSWVFCVAIVAALPVVGSVNAAAARQAPSKSQSALSSHLKPFLSETPRARAASSSHAGPKRATSEPVALHVVGSAGAPDAKGRGATAPSSAPLTATQPEALAGFMGATQAYDVNAHGSNQEIAPPDTDIAAGPSDVVTTVNSTIDAFSRSGSLLSGGSEDLNFFFKVESGHYSSDPRVIYDAGSQRWWMTITEVPNDLSCDKVDAAAPVLIAVSGSSNPLPFTSWTIYALPFVTANTFLGDQPGLGVSNNTLAVSFNDYDCNGNWLGSDIDILQKSDLEHDTISSTDVPYTDGSFAPQPVQSFGSTTTQYVVANDSDCSPCTPPFPAVEVDPFTGTPEGKDVAVTSSFPAMAPTAVDPTSFSLPPAVQKGTATTINTDDDRFLNAVWENGVIWTAGGTDCVPTQPTTDSVPRSCLDYVGITASSTGTVNSTITQINNVGVSGNYLYYPAVSVDAAGNVFTVFDESSSTTFPTIVDATIPSGGSTLSAFQTLHTSSGFYNPSSNVCQTISSTNACRWGDYSGAAQDPSNPKDVWVVSEAEDGAVSSFCSSGSLCWGSDITQLTLALPRITSLNPAYGAVAGGQTVTVDGTDFGPDTTATFGGTPITISAITPTSFTFVTPSAPVTGGTDQVLATDAEGSSTATAASLFTYLGLSNYTTVSPFRILDTRPGRTCVQCSTNPTFGSGVTEKLQLTGVTGLAVTDPIPSNATAVVLNVTEVAGTANSLLTVYPFGSVNRPTASNLNFPPGKVIANLVTVTMGTGGAVSIYNALGSVNVIVDVEGYFTPQPATDFQGLFHPITPVRVCDTRTPASCDGNAAVGAGKSIVVTVASAGVPSDGTAGAAVVNLTGVAGSASTYLSVFPPDSNGHCNPTGTSNINLLPGAVAANRVMVELGPASLGGPVDALCVYNAVGTINVVIDANGWYGSATATATPAGYQYQPLAPTRICDTRVASTSCVSGAIGAGLTLQRVITVAGFDGVPAFASSTKVVGIIANLTAIAPSVRTYLALYPANLTTRPTVSDVNLEAGTVVPNLAVVQVDTVPADAHDGDVYLYNSAGSVNAIIDIEGWFQ